MSLYEEWKEVSDIDPAEDEKGYKALWNEYLTKETAFYEDILGKKQDVVEGTISELAEKYDVTPVMMAGFMDGISESLKSDLDNLEELEADTQVRLEIDFEKLYYNMVGVPAEWLYDLPQWDDILTAQRKRELMKASRERNTVVKKEKIGRNDPCPCGSGKKYKKCCGRNA
ncbi:SEC-C domain-containing protein [Eubacterium limosum]|uniref:SEC-C metal-binding domain-containing protein n=1 Tax=Eubacterium limosum TaxID=1736 RepID=A0ABT5UPP6_EUBLI|nr:SEC-C metal-binding domain-containing protein [Eubacterium limosum]MCB6569211.1 SEC-C domain-containing protein [Eubacterium limosum]MDE1470910.1 SEC-C metal-binding domain-containing protein [Eubacterium limosum]